MDRQRFDAALRALSAATTRRRGLAAAAGVFLGGAGRDGDARGSGSGKRPGSAGPCGDGAWRDNFCRRGRDCCTGYCQRDRTGRKGQCRYAPVGSRCNKKIFCRENHVCYNGVCTRQQDVPETICKNCSSGCCQGKQCLAGTSSSACGSGGEACAVCPSFDVLCTANSCATGTWSSLSQLPAVAGIKGVAISGDELTLYLSREDGSTSDVMIWTRASTSANWTQASILGSQGSSDQQFITPLFVFLTPDNLSLFVSDSGNNRISIWSRTSAGDPFLWEANVGASGLGDAELTNPAGIAVSPDKRTLYIADTGNNRISVWQRSAADQVFAPQARFGSLGMFVGPSGLAVSPDQKTLYITEPLKSRVQAWYRSSASSTDWGWAAFYGGTTGSGDDEFAGPSGIAVATDGKTLYIVDGDDPFAPLNNKRISIWRSTGPYPTDWEAMTQFGAGVFQYPLALAVAPDNLTMYVTDTVLGAVTTWRQQ